MAESKVREQSFLRGIPVSVTPDSIDRELTTMWKGAAPRGEKEDAGVSPVARVCLANLIWIGTSPSADRARRVLETVAQKYPSRIIIVEIASEDPEDDLIEAFVNAQCFIVGSDRQQVCAEFIHLRIGLGTMRHLSGLIAPLLLPDLESVLWYFSPDRKWQSGLDQLFPLLDRFVTEVSTSPDPSVALEALLHAPLRAFTLGWFRLNALRDRIAKVFDDAQMAALLPEINCVEFRHDGMRNNPNALTRCSLLAGWFASRLGWKALVGSTDGPFLFQGASQIVRVSIEGEGRSRAGLIESVHIGFAKGDGVTLHLGGAGVPVEGGGVGSRGLVLPTLGSFAELEEAEALGAAITTRGASKLFRESAELAAPVLRHLMARAGKG